VIAATHDLGLAARLRIAFWWCRMVAWLRRETRAGAFEAIMADVFRISAYRAIIATKP